MASSDTVVIGDRMDTDIIGGLEAGMHTVGTYLVTMSASLRFSVLGFSLSITLFAFLFLF